MERFMNVKPMRIMTCEGKPMRTTEFFFFFFFFIYDNFTYMSNMFFQLLAWESMG